MKKFFLPFAAVAMALTITACGGQKTANANGRESVEMSGAGATFPLPFYTMSFDSYSEKSGDVVSYGGIGSGGGVRNLKDGIVDFAGSDAFLSDEEMKEMQPVVHIPTCMGAVVMAYNLPEVKSLNLSGDVIADIYLGKITKWNDARIVALNPDAQLPEKDIIPAFRSDGSGTTFVFTDYLTKVSEEWKNTLGSGKTVDFKVGLAAKGNPGVAGIIAQTPYSIGYMGSEYAFAMNIPVAKIQNAKGQFVSPSSKSITASLSGDIPDDLRCTITNADTDGAYPISCLTWILVYKEQNYANRSLEKAQATADLLRFVLNTDSQQLTEKIHYAPLPSYIIEKALAAISSMTYNNQPIN